MRFSNANTTTDRYRFGARPEFPHTALDAAGVVEDDDCFPGEDVVDDGALFAVGGGEVDRDEELQPAANITTRASTARHRRDETTPASICSEVIPQACPLDDRCPDVATSRCTLIRSYALLRTLVAHLPVDPRDA